MPESVVSTQCPANLPTADADVRHANPALGIPAHPQQRRAAPWCNAAAKLNGRGGTRALDPGIMSSLPSALTPGYRSAARRSWGPSWRQQNGVAEARTRGFAAPAFAGCAMDER